MHSILYWILKALCFGVWESGHSFESSAWMQKCRRLGWSQAEPSWPEERSKMRASFLLSCACAWLSCYLLLFLPQWFTDRLKSLQDIFPFCVGKGKWNPFGHVVFLNFKASHISFLNYFTQKPCGDKQGESHFTDEETGWEGWSYGHTYLPCKCFLGPSSGFFLLYCRGLSKHGLWLPPATAPPLQ